MDKPLDDKTPPGDHNREFVYDPFFACWERRGYLLELFKRGGITDFPGERDRGRVGLPDSAAGEPMRDVLTEIETPQGEQPW